MKWEKAGHTYNPLPLPLADNFHVYERTNSSWQIFRCICCIVMDIRTPKARNPGLWLASLFPWTLRRLWCLVGLSACHIRLCAKLSLSFLARGFLDCAFISPTLTSVTFEWEILKINQFQIIWRIATSIPKFVRNDTPSYFVGRRQWSDRTGWNSSW